MTKTKEFNLSEKELLKRYMDSLGIRALDIRNIIFMIEQKEKEFIRLLKKEVIGKQGILEEDYNIIIKEIDKLAGEKLGEDKKWNVANVIKK